MDMLQIVGLGMTATILITMLKSQRPEIAVQLSVIAGIVIFMLISAKLMAVVTLLDNYTKKADIDFEFLSTLLKIIGIAYIAEFGAAVCKDAGESSIASKIELAGKVIIMVIAVPIITSLLDLVVKIMP
ncbi:stage III sporulation protein AD [Anaerobacterium chartisolvens]|uniref:Stage III sporulation protein AD n=1 Tax=Anaerobacterium chartisolvens TaxID=1297424 RepID=A0A369B5K1_9FIRM|nr:stage III sporulation protein AD [Anaerobacterium chartisolvens]RCX16792.1 stage III sporulation protein AD [Anaerobacterium chartisolvens]